MGLFDRIRRAFTGEDAVVKEEEVKEDQIVIDSYDRTARPSPSLIL